jgi:hypothetical protein
MGIQTASQCRTKLAFRVKNIFCVLILAAAIAGWGQASPAARVSAATAARPARALPDSAIEQNIRAKFAKSKINADHFTVSVKNGVAMIDGKTNVIQHKGVATRLAKGGGAIAVNNRIQISAEAKAKAAAGLAKYRQQGQVARAVVIPAKK